MDKNEWYDWRIIEDYILYLHLIRCVTYMSTHDYFNIWSVNVSYEFVLMNFKITLLFVDTFLLLSHQSSPWIFQIFQWKIYIRYLDAQLSDYLSDESSESVIFVYWSSSQIFVFWYQDFPNYKACHKWWMILPPRKMPS